MRDVKSCWLALLAVLGTSACAEEISAPADPQTTPTELAPSPAAALIAEAESAMGAGDLQAGADLLDKARLLDPDSAALWVAIARLRYRGGEHLASLDAADYALELGPQYAPALLLRGQMVRDAHGLNDALPWFEAALAADRSDAAALTEYAATLGDLGRNRDMLEAIERLSASAPGTQSAPYLQAVLAARAGKLVLARSLLARSGLVEQGVPSARLLDAIIALQQANYDSAAASLEALSSEQPANARLRDLHALSLWRGGRDEALIARFLDQAQAPDASAYLIMLVGRALERQGEREQAAPFIEQAYAKAPDEWQTAYAPNGNPLGLPEQTFSMRQLVRSGDRAGAEQLAKQLLERFPGSSDIHVLAGDAALESGDAAKALERYTVAARIRRPWPLTRKLIAAYRELGNDAAARTLLIRYARGEPRNLEALIMLAQTCADEGDWTCTAALLGHVTKLGGANDPMVLALRADAARASGDGKLAKELDALQEQLRPASLMSETTGS